MKINILLTLPLIFSTKSTIHKTTNIVYCKTIIILII